MVTVGQNVKNTVINLHCCLSEEVILFHICLLSPLCYVFVEVNTYEFRSYLLSCCITPSRGCIFCHLFLSMAASLHRKPPNAGTSCGRQHAEDSDRRGPPHLTYEIFWKTYFLYVAQSLYSFLMSYTKKNVCVVTKYISQEDVS